MAVVSAVLMECIGLAIDAGYLQLVKTRVQGAADASAVGGAQEIKSNGSANVVSAARADAALNGFTNGSSSVTVTVNNPPLTGSYTGDSTAVEVLVSQHVSPVFMSLLGFTSMAVNARSVAHQGSGNGGGCLFTLDPSSSASFSLSGGVQLSTQCGVQVNSTSATAMSVSGGTSLTAPSISVAGGYSLSGGSSINPLPTTGVPAVADPLANVPAPSVGACNYTNYSVSGGATKTLSPGVYCNGISVSGGSDVTFNPGVYILKGGGLQLSGGCTATGAGVTFFNTAGGGYGYTGINFSGGTHEVLSAPTTGSLAGILFFQDRSIASPATTSFSGGASAILNGTLYFPTSTLSYSGGTGTAYTILISKKISFSGGAMLHNDYSSLPGGSPIKGNVALSE
jgi:Putative Flp pilus-assembly TadE/G-like